MPFCAKLDWFVNLNSAGRITVLCRVNKVPFACAASLFSGWTENILITVIARSFYRIKLSVTTLLNPLIKTSLCNS
jgi:hypothetical protein